MTKVLLKDGYTLLEVDISDVRSIFEKLAQLYLHSLVEWFQFDQHEDGRYGDTTEELMAG